MMMLHDAIRVGGKAKLGWLSIILTIIVATPGVVNDSLILLLGG
jgi:hypothetical protein